jgi:hypothetical protein
VTSTTFDESKIRRGQLDNAGKFASKVHADSGVELIDPSAQTVQQRINAMSPAESQRLNQVLALTWPDPGSTSRWNDKGASGVEAIELLDAGVFRTDAAGNQVQFLAPVRDARANGASHDEVVDALRRLPLERIPRTWQDHPMSGYADMRQHVPHEDTIDAIETLDPSKWRTYTDLRSRGETHDQARLHAAFAHVHEWTVRTRRVDENKVLGTHSTERVSTCSTCGEERAETAAGHNYSGD